MNIEEEIKIVPIIDTINIVDEGIIEKAELAFFRGLNIIKGPNGSGKTTVLKAIEKESKLVWSFEDLKQHCAASEKIMLSLIGIIQTPVNKCFLMDDILSRVSSDKVKTIIKELEQAKNQIIMTVNSYTKINTTANIIDTTKNVKLKTDRWNK